MELGQTIRVSPSSSSSNPFPRRAEISCVNGDKTVDVIYRCRTTMGEIDEENNVHEDRCSLLLDWEKDNDNVDVLYLKDCGNKLFALKDYEAAVEWYQKGLENLGLPQPSVGCNVVVAPSRHQEKNASKNPSSNSDSKLTSQEIRQRSFRMGTVSDYRISDGAVTCDVMFDDELNDGIDDEEVDVDASRLISIHPDRSKRATQASLYSNLAKSSFFLRRFGWTVRYSSVAIFIQTQDWIDEGDEKKKKSICDMYVVRIRAFLSSARPLLAAKDIKELCQLDETRSKTLTRELEQFKAKRQASNKKLARDVAAWVDKAMQINSQKLSEERAEQHGHHPNSGNFDGDHDDICNQNHESIDVDKRCDSDSTKRSWGQWLSGMMS